METETEQAPITHLDLAPIKQSTEQLCESIVSQDGFPELYKKIEAFISDEKLKYEYEMLNQRGTLLQQKQEAGLEITEAEISEFEKLRDELSSNPVICGFHGAQEEVQQLQDTIHQVIAKSFELGRVPGQEDFDFCSDGFGDCGCG